MTTESVNSDIEVPDSAFEDGIKRQMISFFGLPPEMVDDGFTSEFATTMLAKNALYLKRIATRQDELNPQITNHVNVILNNDMHLQSELKQLMLSNMKELKEDMTVEDSKALDTMNLTDEDVVTMLIRNLSENLEVTLPTPAAYEDDGLQTAFEEYKDSVEDAIEAFFSDDALPDDVMSEEFKGNIDAFRTAAFNTLLRKWMTDNDYLPDLQNMLVKDKYGNPKLDVLANYTAFVNNLTEAMSPIVEKVEDRKEEESSVTPDDTSDENSDSSDAGDTLEEGAGDESEKASSEKKEGDSEEEEEESKKKEAW